MKWHSHVKFYSKHCQTALRKFNLIYALTNCYVVIIF